MRGFGVTLERTRRGGRGCGQRRWRPSGGAAGICAVQTKGHRV